MAQVVADYSTKCERTSFRGQISSWISQSPRKDHRSQCHFAKTMDLGY